MSMPLKLRPVKCQSSQAARKNASQQGVCDGCLDTVAEKDALKYNYINYIVTALVYRGVISSGL